MTIIWNYINVRFLFNKVQTSFLIVYIIKFYSKTFLQK